MYGLYGLYGLAITEGCVGGEDDLVDISFINVDNIILLKDFIILFNWILSLAFIVVYYLESNPC